MKPVVFIHTNEKQMLGAKVAEYALKRNSAHADEFDIRIIRTREYPFMEKYEGREYLRGDKHIIWRNDNLQSFALLRFLPPQLMNYQGRVIVMDPDIFAVGDIYDLLSRDMEDKAILCRKSPYGNAEAPLYATSFMLLDCTQLKHWKVEEQVAEMFAFKRDYSQWIHLQSEPLGSVGDLEEEWNHFDTLNSQTKMLHNTERLTQPWKTGLKIDFYMEEAKNWKSVLSSVKSKIKGVKRKEYYEVHPDPNQEKFFLTLLDECIAKRAITKDEVEKEIAHHHIRSDIFRAIERSKISS